MPVKQVLAVVAVADLEAAVTWYARLFGRPADRRPMATLAEWEDGAGCLQVVRDAARGGKSLLTLAVADLAAVRADLAAAGGEIGEITEGTNVRFATVNDPEGNAITLTQDR